MHRLMEILRHVEAEPLLDEISPDGNTQTVKAHQVADYVLHMPPCMQNIYHELQANHHLKYWGRQHFGIFLKSLGLNITESLVFWKDAFAPKIDESKFNKEYAYNVKHIYGQVGGRMVAPNLTCQKVISSDEPCTGCPFKKFNVDALRASLQRYKVLDEHQINDIISTAKKNQNYQEACTKTLVYTKKIEKDHIDVITHPHLFLRESLRQTEGERPTDPADAF